MNIPRARQHGFSLIAAIFLLVVLSLLGVFMVRISNMQHATVSLALEGARANAAARSGLQWGIANAITNHACPNATFNINGGGGTNFQVAITCSATAHTEHNTLYNVYVIRSVASSLAPAFGQPGYTSRIIVATATDAP